MRFVTGWAAFGEVAVLIFPVAATAGWSSPVARQAHNLKVPASNPATRHQALENT